MKKKILLFLSAVLLLSLTLAVAISAAASESDFLVAPEKELVLGKDYAYSFAVVGDTQIINKKDASSDTAYMQTLYNWIKNNKEAKNIQYVMGVGDITDTFQTSGEYYAAEWANAKDALAILDAAGIPYSLVRGNHDISSGMNSAFGSGTEYYNDFLALAATNDAEGRPMAGFSGEYTDATNSQYKIENTYRKVIIGTDKYLIFTLDWAPSKANLTWIDSVISANQDYKVIVTMHQFLYKEGTFADDADSTLPHENIGDAKWGEVVTGGTELPRTLWDQVLAKYSNVELILCGHEAVENIITTQLRGDNGNTVTAMLVDAQGLDDVKSPLGMVAMLYFAADGSVVHVEYISTLRAADGDDSTGAYFRSKNQFSVKLEYENGWVKTPYGYIPSDEYNKYTFQLIIDDDGDLSTDNIYLGGTDTWVSSNNASGILVDVKTYFNNGGTASKYFKDAYIVMTRDHDGTSDGQYNNIAQIPGDVVLDLGGHNFSAGTKPIFPAYANQKNDYGNMGFAIKNGNVFLSSGAAVALASNTAGDGATYNVTFEKVNFSYASGGTSKNPLATTYAGVSGKVAYVNFNVIDCKIDLTGAPSGTNAFNLSNANNSHVTLTFCGGEIISTSEAVPNLVLAESGDKVFYTQSTDGYTKLTLPTSATAPIGVYADKDGYELGYEYSSKTDSTVTYTLKRKPVSDKGTIDVWLIGGQSNAAGYAQDILKESEYDERYTNGFSNILYYGSADDNVISSFTPVRIGLGAKSNFMGAEIGIASALGSSDGMNAIIKFARGATYLYPDGNTDASKTYGTWTSPSYIASNGISTEGNLNGALYHEFMETVTEGLALLREQGYTPVIRGMWWMQGEAETNREALANEYAALLEALINDVRSDLSTITGTDLSEMPFVAGNVYRNKAVDANGDYTYSQPPYLSKVNEQQSVVAAKLKNVFVVKTEGLEQKDGWHFISSGQKYLGEQFVINVVRASGKFSVITNGMFSTVSGSGSYAAGESVTIEVSVSAPYAINGVTYTEAGKEPVKVTLTDGKYTFTMPANDVYIDVETHNPNVIMTPYGEVPQQYADAKAYPFLLFKNGTCIGAESKWTDGSQIGIMKLVNEATQNASDVVYVLMRADYEFSTGKYDNFSMIKGKVIIDLDGNTFKVSTSQGMLKPNKKNAWNSTYEIKNGAIELNKGAVLNFGANANGVGYGFYISFTDVTISFTKGTTYQYIATTMAGSDLKGYVSQIITFNNCTFDLTNAPSNAILFNLSPDTAKNNLCHATVNGGNVIFGTNTGLTFATLMTGYKDGEADKLVFGKNAEGKYTTFTAPAGASAPTTTFTLDDGKSCVLTKINENSTTAEFKLVDASVGSIEFIPKVSIMLDRELIFNIYVPVHNRMWDLTIDGVSYAEKADELQIVEIGGEEHYLIQIALPSSVAARDINMVCTFALDEDGYKLANAKFVFNTVKYAEKVLADGSDVEKQLVRDVLSYVRAAYAYFGTTDAAKISAINAILGNGYDENNAPTKGDAVNSTQDFAGVSFVLNEIPAIRFYLADGKDASLYEFYVGGIKANTVTGTDVNGNYIELDVYAYAMCEMVTYTVDGGNGGNGGSYNLASYLEYVSAGNDQLLVSLVERFMKYCQSAKAYKLAA